MSSELQFWLALGIVVFTVGTFVFQAFRSRKTGCGGACGCPQKPNRK